MFFSPQELLIILGQYKYWLIFPVAVIEGPIITVISGFLSHLGVLNFFGTYFLLLLGDVTGDVLHYSIGRYWQRSPFIKKHGHFLGYSDKVEDFLKSHFERHKIKTLVVAKFSYGLGTAVKIAAGISKINFFDYIRINLIGSVPKILLLYLIGFYMGSSYLKINGYLNLATSIITAVVILIILFFVSKNLARKYLDKGENI